MSEREFDGNETVLEVKEQTIEAIAPQRAAALLIASSNEISGPAGFATTLESIIKAAFKPLRNERDRLATFAQYCRDTFSCSCPHGIDPESSSKCLPCCASKALSITPK